LARTESQLRELEGEIRAAGGTCHVAPCDVRDREATERAVHQLIEALGGLYALINNAGTVIRKDVFEISPEEWRTLIDTNVHGVFHATRAVLPHLRRQGKGHIINMSSISGRLPLAGGSGYAASKYAVTGFSESLFHEVRDLGIKVTTVFPGSVDTASHRDAADDSGWKVRPEEVGEACREILRTSPTNCISRVEIRPLRKPQG
ncbi:MAG: SDR family NAD(P)-dependent oxidoreductase, partial [Planctomycetota bacterium]|nr:SDR family NAD(P)-dependent oxidoreductase [Planctomycetota bacterium]